MNEQIERINNLFDYKSNTTSGRSNGTTQLNEEQQFKEIMNKLKEGFLRKGYVCLRKLSHNSKVLHS